jgi:hypothetical protein
MKKSQPVPVLIPFLFLVSAIFIGILIYAYVETKKANPQMIEVGRASRSVWQTKANLSRRLTPINANEPTPFQSAFIRVHRRPKMPLPLSPPV